MANDNDQYTRTYTALAKQEMERAMSRMQGAQQRLTEGRGDDDDRACVDFYTAVYQAMVRQQL